MQADTGHTAFGQFILEKAQKEILREFLKGEISLEELLTYRQDIPFLQNISGRYQIIIYERYQLEQSRSQYHFSDLLRLPQNQQDNFEFLDIDNHSVILLRGDFAVKRLKSVLLKYDSQLSPQGNSPLDSFFLSCGREVTSMNDIPQSYQDALLLHQRRFFCSRRQHFIQYDEHSPENFKLYEAKSYQDNELLSEYTNQFVILIQSYNRDRIANLINTLSSAMLTLPASIPATKNWLLDLYLGIKEKIEHFYQSSDIPFISNSGAIQYILNSSYLYEIMDFLTAQFEMIMHSTGNFTRDSIIDVILNYIDHNYSENITLENISPIFGYNSSYLGKIFTEKTGVSFHTYLDNVRVEKAKELLTTTSLQVYRIARQIGYSNVDYFHIKFKKKTGLSPATYRKQNIPEREA